ncbi:BON domain-containing protein [Herbaspirillum sp. GCM10030257]|uniref:BON domain-containing protein n=1 Tax=Herbaspirillum sp. GCM10030257 TaxID=3273393 RepID=UPI0036129F26
MKMLMVFFMFVSTCYGQDADELRNWFNDPFFQVSKDVPDCPVPAGPFVDERAMRNQSHQRAEKGTTCWLAGDCDRQNSYMYDTDIAKEFMSATGERGPFVNTTLWITVQGRVAYIQGCGISESQVPQLEEFARSVRYVQQAFVDLRVDRSRRAPYRLRER